MPHFDTNAEAWQGDRVSGKLWFGFLFVSGPIFKLTSQLAVAGKTFMVNIKENPYSNVNGLKLLNQIQGN